MAEDLPEIAVSRVSTFGSTHSAPRTTTTRQQRPSYPRVDTDGLHKWHWNPQSERGETWPHQFGGPKPAWHVKWKKGDHCFRNGRVFIIDYKSNDAINSESGKRHISVASQEMQSLPELHNFYADSKRVHGAALRVIHVQNAKWATLFLLKKFNINHPDEAVGMPGFSKWAQYEKPRQRNGKPFPNGRTWRRQLDPWRNVARTAFGLDYLRTFPTRDPKKRKEQTVFGDKPVDAKMFHLNSYEDSSTPHGHDVSVQRMSVYVQRNLGPVNRESPEVDIKNPYAKHMSNQASANEYAEAGKVILEHLDNSNTIIIFETSASMMLDDCLVQPRNDLENRWRRLSFYLRKEDVLNDSRLAAQCVNFILSDLFHGLSIVWDFFLGAASDHTALLEDKIYDNPADESRAPELWENQAAWLKVDKVMFIHTDIVREMQGHMQTLADSDDEEQGVQVDWLGGIPAEYDRLSHNVSESLVQPTNNLSDLMYKSVGIRDSRQSLQLGLSMWRLSWITFIFLPLTFIVGFFGMNVNTFESNPDISWYFVAAVVLMVIVLFLWYCVKHSLQRRRQTPYQRGLYESLFSDLEEQHPDLWTASNGAIPDVQPTGFVDRMKWRLIKRWFSPEKTINKRLYSSLAGSEEGSELGAWATFKRYLLLRWLPEIHMSPPINEDSELTEVASSEADTAYEENPPTLGQLAKFSTPVVLAGAEPGAVVPLSTYGLRPLTADERRPSRASVGSRPSSRGSSGIMIEERNLSDSESDAAEGASRSRSAPKRRASTD